MMRTPLLTLLALTACDPFSNLPDQSTMYVDGVLWDPGVTAANDGVYVRLPYAGDLVRLRNDGRYDAVDLKGAEPVRLVSTPSGESILVFARWQSCEDPDVEYADDCDPDELEWTSELAVVTDGVRGAVTTVPAHLNQLAFTDDGSVAVAYLDYEPGQEIENENGVIDLTEVVFIDLASGETQAVSIGISPNNILFSSDSTTAVVMSRSKVVLVDLLSFEKLVEYPLTLDADDEIDPSDAVLTPGGTHVLVAIQGTNELYKLDLQNYSIDIITLDDSPSDLAVSAGADRTVLTYQSESRVDVLEHEYYGTETIELDEPMSDILLAEDQAVLFNTEDNTDYHDVYRLDLLTNELTEYRVANPVVEMQLTEDGQFAVGTLRPEGGFADDLDGYQDARWGLAVVDLSGDDSVSLVLESPPVGLALVQPEGSEKNYALVLLEGSEELLQIDLSEPSAPTGIELPAEPLGIGAMPSGDFFITHDVALGEVSFLVPGTTETTTISGFASADLLGDDELPRQGQE